MHIDMAPKSKPPQVPGSINRKNLQSADPRFKPQFVNVSTGEEISPVDQANVESMDQTMDEMGMRKESPPN